MADVKPYAAALWCEENGVKVGDSIDVRVRGMWCMGTVENIAKVTILVRVGHSLHAIGMVGTLDRLRLVPA